MEIDDLSDDLISTAFFIHQGRALQNVNFSQDSDHVSPFDVMRCVGILHSNGYQCAELKLVHRDHEGDGPGSLDKIRADEIWVFKDLGESGNPNTVKLLVEFNDLKDQSSLSIHCSVLDGQDVILRNHEELYDFLSIKHIGD